MSQLTTDLKQRRQQFFQQLPPNSIAILPAAKTILRNGDSHYPFRQHSDFYYLTGLNEPEAVAVFLVEQDGSTEYILFSCERQPERELWQGEIVGQQRAVSQYGAHKAFAIDTFKTYLAQLLQDRANLYYDVGLDSHWDGIILPALNQLRGFIRRGKNVPVAIYSLAVLLHEQRLFKTEYEKTLMREAAKVTSIAHCAAMKKTRPGLFEYHLAAELHYTYESHGCQGPAYPTIVGSGKNACILHYDSNSAPLEANQLILIDSGAEYQNYAADVTRTFPANGRFSAEQKALYEVVLTAQKAGINEAQVGQPWSAIQDRIVEILTQGLVDLGILKGSLPQLIEEKAYQSFYMHLSGHWLGLDVHDVGAYKVNQQWRRLEPNIALTVEPGLYIHPDSRIDEKWWNMGIRIEDDIIITEKGPEILTAEIPKEVADIEQMMA
jgi:Xaa-Pro aminopeptidase